MRVVVRYVKEQTQEAHVAILSSSLWQPVFPWGLSMECYDL